MTDIRIGDLRPRKNFTAADTSQLTEFAFDFPILAEEDLKVALDTTLLTSSEYAISITGLTGGSVTLTNPPPAGARLTLWRDMPFERRTSFAPGADLRASVLNDELDRTALLLQQVEALVEDSIHRKPFDQDADLTLPTIEERAGRFLSFDTDGKPEAVQARLPGDIQNMALVYSGAYTTANAPAQRPNGTALQPGDLYFDTDAGALMVWDGAAWASTVLTQDSFLALSGSAAMQGDLDLGGNALVNPGLIDGQDVGALATQVAQTGTEGRATQILALNNAWELARLEGLGAYALSNTYIDAFSDESGIATPDATGLAVFDPTQTNSHLVLSADNRTVTRVTGSSVWTAAAATEPKSAGKFYVEITHDVTQAVNSPYTLHGLRLASESTTSPSIGNAGHFLLAQDGKFYDGVVENAREAGFTTEWPGNYVANGTVGTVAVDITAGKYWLGFLRSDNSAYWYGGGDPAAGTGETGSFTAGSLIELVISLITVADYALTLNTGQSPFTGTVPTGFTAGWHLDDADPVGSSNFQYDAIEDSYGNSIHEGLALSTFAGTSSVTASYWDTDGNNAAGYGDTVISGDFDITLVTESAVEIHERLGIVKAHAVGSVSTGVYTGANIAGSLGLKLNGGTGVVKDASTSALAGFATTPTAGDVFRLVRSGRDVALYQNGSLLHTETDWGAGPVHLINGHHNGGAGTRVRYTVTASVKARPDGAADWVGKTGSYTLSGSDLSGAADGAVYWTQVLSGDFSLSFTPGSDPSFGAWGVFAAAELATFDQNDGNDGGLEAMTSSFWYLRNGAQFKTGATVEASGVAWSTSNWEISRTGSTLSVRVDGVLRHSFTAAHAGDLHFAVASLSGYTLDLDHIALASTNGEDMTLVTKPITATGRPDMLHSWIDLEQEDPATAGTDFTLEASRDDGASWKAIPLTTLADLVGDRAIYDGTVDMTGEADGTAVRLRLVTSNGKRLTLHRWALQADQALTL